MARNRRSAYGTPPEARELVVSVDRRLLYGLGVVAAFVAAVAVGMWWTSRSSSTAEAPAPAPGGASASSAGTAAVPGAFDEASARATAAALGLPTSVSIIQPMQSTFTTAVPPAAGTPEPGANAAAGEAGATATAANPLQEALLRDPNTVQFDVPEDRKVDASKWGHTTLANFPDPNVTAEQTTPVRLEESKEVLAGPRIAVSDLNSLYTYDYGVVPMDRPAVHDFKVANVGDADLVISRIYTACGCTATKIGGQTIDPAGWLPNPVTLKPGQSEVFTVAFDPQAEGKAVTQAKYIQIFSNDPTRALFDAADPLSHEIRFRIVVEPKEEGGS